MLNRTWMAQAVAMARGRDRTDADAAEAIASAYEALERAGCEHDWIPGLEICRHCAQPSPNYVKASSQ
jgi:hypothetical protein